MNPLTSSHTFVIAAYKDSVFIEECIKSLKNQSVKSLIQITTSTPSPFLKDIAAKYNIPLIINDQQRGIASDWTFAYKSCSTRYLTIAHQDDIYAPAYTESCLSLAAKYSNSLIIFTDYAELRDKKIALTRLNFFIKKMLLWPFVFRKGISSCFLKKLVLSFGNPICCPSVMYDKVNIGPLEFSQDFVVSLDWYEWIQLSKRAGSFLYLSKNGLSHRIHKETASSRAIAAQVRKNEDEVIFKSLWPDFLARIFSSLYSLASQSTVVDRPHPPGPYL